VSHPPPTYAAASDHVRGRQALRHLSPSLAVLAAAVFAGGYIAYLHRSPMLHKHLPGTAAWPQQLAVAVLAGALLGYAYWRHHRTPGRPGEPPWLLSPLGKPAARRPARTIRTGPGGPSASGRAALALPLAGLFLYGFYRAGEQVTAGLDPNFTVNAWGGPTYLGAMASHYLDLLVLMSAAAWLLHLILPPDPANAATDSAARSHASPTRSAGYSHVREKT
jgi:hypothetical protein